MVSFPIISGIIASILHVISGPDHLAAVTPLAIETKGNAWKVGLFWGFGHIIGMLLIGLLFLMFQDLIPVDSISNYSEQLVAIVLIGVGAWALYKFFKPKRKHAHSYSNQNFITPENIGEDNCAINTMSKSSQNNLSRRNFFSSLGIGFLHGLAGVAHFLLLLPVLSFESNFQGIQYIVGFALGTIIAMSIYALLLSKIASFSKTYNNKSFFKAVRVSGGLFALFIGFYWLYLTF